jgi:hypothetical protein
VRFAPGASAATIGAALVNAIRNSTVGLVPTYAGNGLVILGGDANTVLDLSQTQLQQSGTPGLPAAQAIKISAADSVDSSTVSSQIAAAINAANLSGVKATPFGDRVVISGAADVAGSQTTIIQGITDNAGNALKPNQIDGTSTLTIFLGEGLDYGDAPDPNYPSKRDSNGPRHTVVPGFSLGADVRPDADAKLTDADEFDDGVVFNQSLVAGFQSTATVSLTRPTGTKAYLHAWIDYNHDGIFSSSEQIARQELTQATTSISFVVASGALTGTTYARFRMSSDQASIENPTGVAPDGEVEDYQVTIVGSPYQNPTNHLDVNGDGFVSPIDALQVINYLNDPTKPKTLTLPHVAAPPYIDVDGDGFAAPKDVLFVINYLNTLPPTGGEGEAVTSDASGSAVTDAQTFGSGVASVSAGNWLAGIERLAAPQVKSSAAIASDSDTDPADAFFASVSDSDELADLAGVPARTQPSVHDSVLATLASDFVGDADQVADEVAGTEPGSQMRQRLASYFRR